MKKLLALLLFMLLFFSTTYARSVNNKRSFSKPSVLGMTTVMDVNNISLKLNNAGEYGMEEAFYPKGSSNTFLYAGGLGLSGYRKEIVDGKEVDSLRVSWVIAASRIFDFQPGPWGTDPDDAKARLYEVRSADLQGSQSYIDWADAVSVGAEYVDVDGDGKYDPTVDKPDLLGDRTIWCVYNDGVPFRNRDLGGTPLGVEIYQSIWGFARGDALGDVLFIRYRIKNTIGQDINDVIFSAVEDPDLGDYQDDLIGCDTTLSLGYIYNDKDDNNYGVNPPAFGIDFFQGPVVVSPGDTAYKYLGPNFGIDTLVGFKNLPMTSFMYYIQSHPTLGDPRIPQDARNYMLGGVDRDGNPIDPMNFAFGKAPYPVNPRYLFSGDPVTGEGWLDQSPADKRFMVNCGPFDLKAGEIQDVVLGFVVAQGTDALNSVTKMKETDIIAQTAYNANFSVAGPPPIPAYQVRVFKDKIQFLIDIKEDLAYDVTDKLLNRQVFQGLEIYQFKGNNTQDVVNDVPNAKVIARFDVKDSINNIYDLNSNGVEVTLGWEGVNNLDPEKFKDENKYLLVEVSTDAFTQLPLVPFQTYYFAIVPFSVDVNHIYPVAPGSNDYIAPPGAFLKNARIPIAVTLSNQEDVKWETYTTNNDAVQHQGKSEGDLSVEVINPDEITGDQYRVEFFNDGSFWRLINTTKSDTVMDSLQNQIYNDDDWSFPIVDGLMFRVINKEDRIKNVTASYDTTDTNNVLWFDGQGTFLAEDSAVFNGGINYAKYFKDAQEKGLTELVTRDQYFPVKVVVDTADKYLAYRYALSAYRFMDTIRTFIAAYDVSDPDNPRQLNIAIKVPSPAKRQLDFNNANTNYIYVLMSDYDETGKAYPDTVNNIFRDAYLVMNFKSDTLFKNNVVELTVEPTFVNSDADVFTVDASQLNPRLTTEEKKNLLNDVKVVPNPYWGYSTYENSYDTPVIKFTHLPGKATIRIFNLAGQLVNQLEKNDNNSFITWNLKNFSGLKIASGIYIAYIEVPGVGSKVIKFAVVQREERIDRY